MQMKQGLWASGEQTSSNLLKLLRHNETHTDIREPDPEVAAEILGIREISDGKGLYGCKISIAYQGVQHEWVDMIGRCSEMNARIVSKADLETTNSWTKLHPNGRKMVEQMPEKKVLYTTNQHNTTVFPLDEKGTRWEFTLAKTNKYRL